MIAWEAQSVRHAPAMAVAHGTVGLQHATMAVYNACCDHLTRLMQQLQVVS